MINRELLQYKASELRKRIGASENAPISFDAVLNYFENITLVITKFDSDISGLIYCLSNDEFIIALNSKLLMGDYRFAFAHELYHFLYSTTKGTIITKFGQKITKNIDEKKADLFASYFLVSNNGIIEFLSKHQIEENSKIEIQDLLLLENEFNVPHSVIVDRLIKLDYKIDENISKLNNKELVDIANNLNIDCSSLNVIEEKDFMVMGHFAKYLEVARENGSISLDKYESIKQELGVEIGKIGEIEDGPE